MSKKTNRRELEGVESPVGRAYSQIILDGSYLLWGEVGIIGFAWGRMCEAKEGE